MTRQITTNGRDTAVLYYAEDNGRVTAAEPIVNFKKDYGDERVLNLKVTLDSLTGASPNGATSSSQHKRLPVHQVTNNTPHPLIANH